MAEKASGWLVRAFTRARSVFGIAFLIPYTFVCSIGVIFVSFLGLHDLASTLTRGWAGVVLWMFGIRVDIRGEENLPETGGGIVLFNHQSLFDIPVLMVSSEKNIRFGAKIELFKIPFFGAAMRACGTLPIARENRSEVMRIYKDAEVKFRDNWIFILAPEGTRQKEPMIGRFKKGPFIFAINAQVPLIPVVIKGAHPVLPKKSLAVNVGRMTSVITAEFLPPVSTKGESTSDIDGLVERVRQSVVEKYASP